MIGMIGVDKSMGYLNFQHIASVASKKLYSIALYVEGDGESLLFFYREGIPNQKD
jgi:hypothetical protein